MVYVIIVQDMYNEMEMSVTTVYRETDDFVGVYRYSQYYPYLFSLVID